MIRGIHHVSLRCDDPDLFTKAAEFYCDVLKLKVARQWDRGIMIDTGNGLIEVFNNQHGDFIKGAVAHFALASDNVDADIERVRQAGYSITREPRDIVIRSEIPFPARMAFCIGPLGEEIEIFQEKTESRG